jgi:hypothetical protein
LPSISGEIIIHNTHFLTLFNQEHLKHLVLCYNVYVYKFYDVAIWVMDPKDDVMGHNQNNIRRTKAAAIAIPMVGAIVTAAAAILLSGLSFIGTYSQPVLAQMDTTTQYGGGGATTGGGGGAAGGGGLLGNNQTTAGGNATNATMAAGGNATNATMAAGGNATIGGQVSEEEGGRVETEEERTEGENESPGQTLAEEEQ